MYKAIGNQVFFVHRCGDSDLRCSFDAAAAAEKAATMLNKADYLNNVKRQYTASARLHAEVEALPGFVTAEDDLTDEQESGYNAMIGASLKGR